MEKNSLASSNVAHFRGNRLGRFGQQFLNLIDLSGARAAERRSLRALDRRELDDCGLTPADVDFGGFDLYAQDFRVHSAAERRAA